MPRLTQLVLLIMKSLPRVNEVYLNYINDNESLYAIAPIEIKRQIWSLQTDLFLKELQPHIDKFISFMDENINSFDVFSYIGGQTNASNAQLIHQTSVNEQAHNQLNSFSHLISHIAYSNFFLKNPNKHRFMQPVNDILRLIGTSFVLYKFTLDRLEKSYLKSHNWFYATLRNQLQIKMILSEDSMNHGQSSAFNQPKQPQLEPKQQQQQQQQQQEEKEKEKETQQQQQSDQMQDQINDSLMDTSISLSGSSGPIFSYANIPNGETHMENLFKLASSVAHCLREKRVDQKRIKEIEAVMESKKFEKIISHLALVVADPFVIDMLSRNCQSLLNKCVQSELLPRVKTFLFCFLFFGSKILFYDSFVYFFV